MPPPQRPRSMPTRGRSPPPEPERLRPRPHSALGVPTKASRLVADIHDPRSRLPPDIRLYHQYQFALAGETLACGGYAHSIAIAEEARRAGWVNPLGVFGFDKSFVIDEEFSIVHCLGKGAILVPKLRQV